MMLKKIPSLFFVVLMMCVAVLPASTSLAQTLPKPIIEAKSWALYDVTSGQFIDASNHDLKIEPASLTKIMTAYLTFQALKEKRLDLNQSVNISANAMRVDKDSSLMFIDTRIPVTINELLYGLIVQSGNDASVALAEAVAGSESAFAALMNKQAAVMGMKSTSFANSHGLPDARNYSTANDLAILASRLIQDFPEYYKTYYSTKEYTYNKIKQTNRNRLLWVDPTVDGMKTGHTQVAGFCLISSANRPNGSGMRRLIAVVTGTKSDQARAQESLKLLNWGYLNFDTIKLYDKGQEVASADVWKGSTSKVKLGFNRDLYVTVPRGMAGKIKTHLERKDPLVAPLAANSQVGVLKMTIDGKDFMEFPIQSLENVDKAGIFGRAWDSMRLWFK